MPHSTQINRDNPVALIFLVDQSGSMAEPFGLQPETRKADGVADAINRVLQSLVLRCARAEGVRDYFRVGLIGYGSRVVSAFGGSANNCALVKLSELAAKPARVEDRVRKVGDGAGKTREQKYKFPVWLDPVAAGKTPMCSALNQAHNAVVKHIEQYPRCFPPLVFNITDGAATDGDPEPAAEAIRDMASWDGNVLLFNIHVSVTPVQPIRFPDEEETMPDDYARLLFRMSSVLPEQMRDAAAREGHAATERTRGFVFNGDFGSIVQFLDVGTKVDRNLER